MSKWVTNSPDYKQQKLIAQLAIKDPGLSQEDRDLLHQKLSEPGAFEKLMHGALGANIAYLIAKFFKMGKNTQVLASMMGFGLGSIMLHAVKQDGRKPKKPNTYNKDTNAYEVN